MPKRIRSIRDTNKFIIEKVGKNKSWSMHRKSSTDITNYLV